MANIENFDRSNLRALQTELEAAINAVAEANGISITMGVLRFSADGFGVKLTGQTLTNTTEGVECGVTEASVSVPVSLTAAMGKFKIHADTNRKGDRLISYHPNRPKYPFVYQSAGGVRWKATVEQARVRFGAA